MEQGLRLELGGPFQSAQTAGVFTHSLHETMIDVVPGSGFLHKYHGRHTRVTQKTLACVLGTHEVIVVGGCHAVPGPSCNQMPGPSDFSRTERRGATDIAKRASPRPRRQVRRNSSERASERNAPAGPGMAFRAVRLLQSTWGIGFLSVRRHPDSGRMMLRIYDDTCQTRWDSPNSLCTFPTAKLLDK